MSRANKIVVTLWLVIVSLGGPQVASPEPPNDTPARYTGADVVVVDVNRLMETFEPLRKASVDLRREAAEGREKLTTDLRDFDIQLQERLLSYIKGTPEYRKEEAELWKSAMKIYSERVLFVQRLRERQSEAYAHAYTHIKQEIERFQHEHRIGVVLNSGLPFELPKLEPANGAEERIDIGISRERGVLWWTIPVMGAVPGDKLRRRELPTPPPDAKPAVPGQYPFYPLEFPEPMIPTPRGPRPPEVEEQVSRPVVSVSADLDVTALIQERLAKASKKPGQAEPGVGADSR